eukprot:5963190-Prymnesium_polylepis.1
MVRERRVEPQSHRRVGLRVAENLLDGASDPLGDGEVHVAPLLEGQRVVGDLAQHRRREAEDAAGALFAARVEELAPLGAPVLYSLHHLRVDQSFEQVEPPRRRVRTVQGERGEHNGREDHPHHARRLQDRGGLGRQLVELGREGRVERVGQPHVVEVDNASSEGAEALLDLEHLAPQHRVGELDGVERVARRPAAHGIDDRVINRHRADRVAKHRLHLVAR